MSHESKEANLINGPGKFGVFCLSKVVVLDTACSHFGFYQHESTVLTGIYFNQSLPGWLQMCLFSLLGMIFIPLTNIFKLKPPTSFNLSPTKHRFPSPAPPSCPGHFRVRALSGRK